MPRDPVLVAQDLSAAQLRSWFDAMDGYLQCGSPSLAEVQALGVLADVAWKDVLEVAMQQPDEGSGERYRT